VLISLDASKRINNGQPSLWASHLDRLCVGRNDHVLHLGCGTGYYTAILAELVGPEGKVTAIEIDAAIADRARIALSLWPQVTVIHADGSIGPFEPVDDLVVSAGATHPPASWLAAIKPGGKLLFPLTPERDAGVMAHLVRVNANTFKARLVYGVDFIPFHGARSPVASRQLAQALDRDRGESVRSLRCDAHPTDNTCWLHGDGWCFSMRDPAPG
jgi:protein-L-isoaspartate(D-aspartate) O-methyltransferase